MSRISSANHRRPRRILGAVAVVVAAAMATAGVEATAATPASAATHHQKNKVWSGLTKPQQTPSVRGAAAVRPGLTPAQQRVRADAPHPYKAPAVVWPSGSATLVPTPASDAARTSAVAGAGSLPVSVAAVAPGGSAAKPAAEPAAKSAAKSVAAKTTSAAASATAAVPVASVAVSVAPHAAATAAGVSGVVFTVARADRAAGAAPVSVSLDYAAFAAAYGGGWQDRLKLVELPACALTTPKVAACRAQTPVAFSQDSARQTLTATVPVGPGGVAAKAQATRAGAARAGSVTAAPMVLAATSSGSGSVGSYTATDLSPSGSWSAGGNSGDFTYSYPVTLPTAATGATPGVTLAYDSGTVDARTSATNAQASWIGDGWDYTPGFVERSYQPCSQDGISNSNDQCWGGNQVQLSLGSHSATLVLDSSGVWKSQTDDGTVVTELSNQGNGAYDGEAWKVVTPDGTQYYFGTDSLPGTASGASTDSVLTEPVYCPKSGDGPMVPAMPSCNSSAQGAKSVATAMGYRWNLAYVVDPHGNLQTYDWTPETNYYSMGGGQNPGKGVNTVYSRGSYLSSISYGYRLADAVGGAEPVDVVNFGVAERCVTSTTVCAPGNLSASTAANWPDVPFDLVCTQNGTCSNSAPSFFSTKRLTQISTEVLVGGVYKPVDSYALTQMFPAPQAGVVTSGVSSANQGDGTVAVMWLSSIQRTGQDALGGGAAASTPPVTFVADEMPNRVDGPLADGTTPPALYRPRMDSVTTESGAQIVVSYGYQPGQQCSRLQNAMPAGPDSNTMNCFPVYWTDSGSTSSNPDNLVLDWFNKPEVTEVTTNDLVAPAAWSQTQTTQYSYAGIAWHRDDSPLTLPADRTWDDFRGYRTVTTTTGTASAESVPTQTVTTYLQGMDGDYKADGSRRSVTVADTVGDQVTDSDWLSGQPLETDTLLGVGGPVQSKTVDGPWTFTTTATENQAESMPPLLARMGATSESRSYELLHDGSWRRTETDTAYDSSGRVTTVDAKGDGTAADPEVCTTTSYAAEAAADPDPNLLRYPDEVKAVQGACGTAATAADTVSDTLTFYDSAPGGSLTGPGNVTSTSTVDSYDASGDPVYVTGGSKQYDVYGRVTQSTDPKGHVTSVAYSAPGASPATVTTTGPMTTPSPWTSTQTMDPARGLPVASTDVNGELTTETYDGLGRLTAEWSPLHAQSAGAPADTTVAYAVNGASGPSTTSTSKLRDDGSYATTVVLYDGQMRQIQSQAPTADAEAGRLITDTHYNALGQTVKTTGAYYDRTAGPATTVFVPANDSVVPSETETLFDGMGRTVKVLAVAYGVNQDSTTTAYPGADQTDVTPPTGSRATSTFTDAQGRTTATWSYNTPAPTDKAADAIVTGYTYTPAGKLATMTDAGGNRWVYSYDLHGRQTKSVDPGAGTSTTGYDADGNTLTTTDARGTTLTYAYDALDRKTAEYDTTGGAQPDSGDELAAWTYDSLEKGQPTAQIRYTDGAADAARTYTTAVTGYTPLYQATGSKVTVPSAEGALAGTYAASSQYTAQTSELTSTGYGAEGGLPADQVNYTYTLSGLLNGFNGDDVYLNEVSYSPFGQVTGTNFGVWGDELNRAEVYDQSTGRLLTVSDQLQTLASPLQTTDYTYNQAGSLTSESAAQYGVGTADTQCFGYDQQDRLTSAWTDTNGVASTTGSTTAQVQGIGGCNDSAPVAGKVTGGPAPYWQTYSYDALGDRVGETQHDTSVSSTSGNTTQTLGYPGYNPATGGNTTATTPDAVQTATVTGPNGTATTSYGYDPAGNTTSRTVTKTGTINAPASQTIGYDAEGRTQTVKNTATGAVSSYTYDASGNLLLQHDPAAQQTVLYLPFGEQITLDTATQAVSGQRYYSASPDGVQIVLASSGATDYELPNTQGTAETTVDATTSAYAFRYFDPYGQPRGATPAAWPDQHSYLGQAQDPTTGLDLLGAREYDPATGRFQSVDPVLESGDTTEMNGYAYAGDNPVANTDPTGLTFIRLPGGGDDTDDNGGCDAACQAGGGAAGGGAAGGGGGTANGSEGRRAAPPSGAKPPVPVLPNDVPHYVVVNGHECDTDICQAYAQAYAYAMTAAGNAINGPMTFDNAGASELEAMGLPDYQQSNQGVGGVIKRFTKDLNPWNLLGNGNAFDFGAQSGGGMKEGSSGGSSGQGPALSSLDGPDYITVEAGADIGVGVSVACTITRQGHMFISDGLSVGAGADISARAGKIGGHRDQLHQSDIDSFVSGWSITVSGSALGSGAIVLGQPGRPDQLNSYSQEGGVAAGAGIAIGGSYAYGPYTTPLGW
ncbi:RHS repeat-associated core domain-containing protein [Streptacidiphilus sp. PB12-B1b]|uniref:RHS repeat domain-containing protein n=1 Tax=Streptacidiphilus sp. PB12-B1b TaxID=2705012 RepID=UPI0015FAA9A5|nr:RHS repeat-associated core domain-containing protein [Streptacidiphilus sp. PB12-B1b]QMU77975.1 RHS repeat-associated core domain-containing protein [Streptacidiphilus sp. PB12-B1b]